MNSSAVKTVPRALVAIREDGKVHVAAPNGTVVILQTDEVSGGIRVTHNAEHLDAEALSVTPIGLGVLVLNARAEGN